MHPDSTDPDLYIAPSSRPLLFSFASALLIGHPAEIFYMNDYAPLPAAVESRLRQAFPHIRLTICSDQESAEAFATLPGWMPGLLRRNIAPRGGRLLVRPADQPPVWLGPRYRNAYLYLTGPFMTKTLRHRCQTIILRENGLDNYHPKQVGWIKAAMRAMSGLRPRYKMMGEEDWVNRIELARPEDLPRPMQRKAHLLHSGDLMARLPAATSRTLAEAFWTGPPFAASGPGALVLSQPLASLGFAGEAEARRIYGEIVSRLESAGYEVTVKRHPQEVDEPGAHVRNIPAYFPIEGWPWISHYRFSIAVALCSASLDTTGMLFSDAQLQLVRPEAFGCGNLAGWDRQLEAFQSNPGAVLGKVAESGGGIGTR